MTVMLDGAVALRDHGEDGAVAVPRTAPPRRLSEQELAEAGPPEAVRLPLDLVDPNPRNPRQHLPEIPELADNIKAFGLLQPVTVRRAGERYELLGGHRRRAAFALLREREPLTAAWRTIPAVVRTADDDLSYRMLLSAQVHNRNWKPKEEAAALEVLAETHTLKQIGEMLHRGEQWAGKRLRVYADSVLSGYVQSGQIASWIAVELLYVPDVAMRREYAERAVAEGWTQGHARAEVRKLRLDRQLRELDKRVTEMLDVLSSIEPGRIPIATARNLQVLYGRIEQISGISRPKLPTIEAAERAAGVHSGPSRRQKGKRKPGYKPRV